MPVEKRSHGVYSSKTKGNDKAADSFGKPYLFNCTLAPYYEAPRDARSVYKGKQIITKTHLPHFSKLEYAPEPYDDNAKKEKERKIGFATVRGGGQLRQGAVDEATSARAHTHTHFTHTTIT